MVWKSASGEGAASSLWNQAKLKCQSRGRGRLSVFRGCRDAAGPQGALQSHRWGSYHLHWSGSAFWVAWGRGGSGGGAHAARFRGCGAAGAPWSEEAASAGRCCSWPVRNPVGARVRFGTPPPILALRNLGSFYLVATTDKDACGVGLGSSL